MAKKLVVRRTNPKSRWPYRILRITHGRFKTRTHKLLGCKFETKEAALAYLASHDLSRRA